MDLKKFYFDNVSAEEYYHQFTDLISHSNQTYNIFEGYQETETCEFFVYDTDEAIEKFRYICQPENEGYDKERDCWFYLVSYYLYKCGFVIVEFPRVLERPPKERYEFVNKEIRNKIIAQGKDDKGTVRYSQRRILVANLTFQQKENNVELVDAIEAKFKEISNRQASFQSMPTEERIAEIANLIENMLKKDGKFITPDYSRVCFDYITEDAIKRYRKKIQCFRHSSDESIVERESFTKEQKVFLIDYGLTIIKVIHALLEEE